MFHIFKYKQFCYIFSVHDLELLWCVLFIHVQNYAVDYVDYCHIVLLGLTWQS